MRNIDYNYLFIEHDSELTKTLSQSEIYQYFEEYYSGDMNARNLIIQHNIHFVIYKVLTMFENTPYHKSELISIGLIGLIKSVDTFDISKNFKFTSYAAKCIINEIFKFMRKEKKHVNNNSFDSTIVFDKHGNELKLIDILPAQDSDFVSDYEKKESYRIIREIVESLPNPDKEIIKLYFGFIDDKPFSQMEIADKYGVSQPTISRIITKALKKISIKLKRQEIIEKSRFLKTNFNKNKSGEIKQKTMARK